MEIKKSAKANLENKRLLFMEIGLILALVAVYIAFDWSTEEQQVTELEDTTQIIEVEEILPTHQDTPPPPPSAPKMPVLSDQIDIVETVVRGADLNEKVERRIHLRLGLFNRISNSGPRENMCRRTELIASVCTERVPIGDRKTQLLLQGFTSDDTILVIPTKSQRILRLRTFVFDLVKF